MEEGLLTKSWNEEEEKSINGGGKIVMYDGERMKISWRSLSEEVKKVGWIAAPMVAVVLSQYMILVIPTMMVGHLGELSLSSSSIALSLAGVTGFSFHGILALGMLKKVKWQTVCSRGSVYARMGRLVVYICFVEYPHVVEYAPRWYVSVVDRVLATGTGC